MKDLRYIKIQTTNKVTKTDEQTDGSADEQREKGPFRQTDNQEHEQTDWRIERHTERQEGTPVQLDKCAIM